MFAAPCLSATRDVSSAFILFWVAVAQVVVCKAGETSSMCSDGSAAAAETKGAVYIRPGLTDAQLKVALQVWCDA